VTINETRCWRWTTDLLHERCVSTIREITRKTLADWGMTDIVDDVTVIVSELATNVVLHAKSGLKLALSFDGWDLIGEITDYGLAWAPAALPESHDMDAEHGRGLAIVAALAHRWGTAPNCDGTGTRVWFTMKRSLADAPDRAVRQQHLRGAGR
jgi:anti-sigma regulatory factor (Ser/Thr protein kinase)